MEAKIIELNYKTKKLEKVCESYKIAKREYGERTAKKIVQRISELNSVGSIDVLLQYKLGRVHLLKGDRDGEYAMDLIQPYRLIFKRKENSNCIIIIIEIIDYH